MLRPEAGGRGSAGALPGLMAFLKGQASAGTQDHVRLGSEGRSLGGEREEQHLCIQIAWAQNLLLVNLKTISTAVGINIILIKILRRKQSFSQINAGAVSAIAG